MVDCRRAQIVNHERKAEILKGLIMAKTLVVLDPLRISRDDYKREPLAGIAVPGSNLAVHASADGWVWFYGPGQHGGSVLYHEEQDPALNAWVFARANRA